MKLTNKKELLQKWITAYNEKLKPALYMGKFRFNNEKDFIQWKNLKLEKLKTQWGCEAAGNIYTNSLQPEVLTLYTNQNKANLIKEFKLLPDPDENVFIYEKIWNDKQPLKNVVPPLIAYADLLATGKR
ncbi:MAG TPA: type IV toxin-antitoxin system AbiEi family antitoxin [Candidatus Cloacimonadota bacterium]|nr:type IV toxin-antitoxin system AbiEi family antitoxin [Candidatus Cloacimonadota bacterium]